jgi:hypothetical protein
MLDYCGERDVAATEQRFAAIRIPQACFVTVNRMNHIEALIHHEAILPRPRVPGKRRSQR